MLVRGLMSLLFTSMQSLFAMVWLEMLFPGIARGCYEPRAKRSNEKTIGPQPLISLAQTTEGVVMTDNNTTVFMVY